MPPRDLTDADISLAMLDGGNEPNKRKMERLAEDYEHRMKGKV